MKRINIIYLFLMLAVFGSCLDEDPKYTTNSKVVYSDEQSAQMALTGIYGLMAVQGSFAQLLPEINTEASGLCWTSYNTSDNRCQYTAGAIPTENEFNNLVWGALYQAIVKTVKVLIGVRKPIWWPRLSLCGEYVTMFFILFMEEYLYG